MAGARGPVGAAARYPLPAVVRLRSVTPRHRRARGPMNPYWLAIDPATDVASVAVSTRAGTVARSVRGARQHAAQIVPLLDEVLRSSGVRKSTRLNSSHGYISYAVFCL